MLIGVLAYLLMRFVVLKSIFHFFKSTSTKLDDILVDSGFLNRISYSVPILLVKNLIGDLIGDYTIINRLN